MEIHDSTGKILPGLTVRFYGGIEGTLARLQISLDRFEANQTKALNTLEESYDAKVRRMRGILADLSKRYRDTPMAGRSNLQQAVPLTFGFKCACLLAACGQSSVPNSPSATSRETSSRAWRPP